jgi:hypothetical protein
MNVDLTITGRVESLHLEPGDTIVATTDERLTSAQGERLRKVLAARFPDHDVLVAAGGVRISKVEAGS